MQGNLESLRKEIVCMAELWLSFIIQLLLDSQYLCFIQTTDYLCLATNDTFYINDWPCLMLM